MEFFTVGVFNSTEQEFFNKLTNNNVDTFCDIRQRRGVRGSKYSFVNSTYLQQKLESLGIKYAHVAGLAPSTEIRDLQRQADKEKGELKTQRQLLSDVFVAEYKQKILSKFDFSSFFENLERAGASKIVLFCVEEQAKACHRSIVAAKLLDDYHRRVIHL